MFWYKFSVLILSILLSCWCCARTSEKINVVFVSCCLPKGFFWPKVESFMHAAAQDLNINLEVLYAGMDYMTMRRMAESVANRDVKPDYMIIDNYKRMGGKIIKSTSQSQVKIFLMANGLTEEQAFILGQPRENYPNWIGELTPDNYFAGYQLAKAMIEDYQRREPKNVEKTINIIALSGDTATPASIERVNGLKGAVLKYSNVDIKQVIPCNWQKQEAYRRTNLILKRYSDINIFWAANDEMALGAIESVIRSGKTPGKDIMFGGINWKKEALQKISDGSMVVSMGGHFMIGGWSLIMIHDYHFGKDFINTEGVKLKMKIFDELNKNNLNRYLSKLGDENWNKIDFKYFSKVYNKKIDKYDFSVRSVLNHLN
ncbi:ABC transporter substrate-binding protein [Spartinivicinus ruber]|uniref:ABC transporter substrate-binding protein n=1 Tax=Spartinivicinus ruber TaxID=2683272 RepID=UPI0022A807D1|nr:ABC transporter substrate-binding protein [Spartinivicinus ruber]